MACTIPFPRHSMSFAARVPEQLWLLAIQASSSTATVGLDSCQPSSNGSYSPYNICLPSFQRGCTLNISTLIIALPFTGVLVNGRLQ